MPGVLGKSRGLFRLDDSDGSPGSFFRPHDAAEILGVSPEALEHIPVLTVEGETAIDERDLQRAFYAETIMGAPRSRMGTARRSLDELIVECLLRREFPGIVLTPQVKWGRKSLDLLADWPDGTRRVVEFHGPSHFAPSRYSSEPKDPRIRQRMVEAELGCECVIWPYWIQRCVSNARAVHLGPEVMGYGLLWSTNTHFGDFIFPDSAALITEITDRFNASRPDGYGYFYGPDTEGRRNPEHPIVASIHAGRASVTRLLPRGYLDESRWLPPQVRS